MKQSKLHKLHQTMDLYEYPGAQIQEHGGIPQNTAYNYVSHSFLNGLVNYGECHIAYLLHRYGLQDEKRQDLVTESMTPADIETLYQQHADKAISNVHLHLAGDDWFIFYKTDVSYVFMWYDTDCSDCSVERWSIEDCTEHGVAALEEFVEERLKLWRTEGLGAENPVLVRANGKLRGWIQW